MRWFPRSLKRHKYIRRLGTILANSLNTLLLPALNITISFLVIRLAGNRIWGEFVGVLILIQLGTHLIAWGNKEHLLREFSRHPTNIQGAWSKSLYSRVWIFLILCFGVLVWFRPSLLTAGLMVWGFGLLLSQSADVLILYNKDFLVSILVELCSLAIISTGILTFADNLTTEILVILFALVNLAKGVFYLAFYHPYTLGKPTTNGFDLQFLVRAFPFFLLTFSGLLNSRMDLYVVNLYFSNEEVARYQVFINLMIYLQSTGAFILTPFVKNLYRLGYPTLIRISRHMFILGVLLLPPALLFLYHLLPWLYQFQLPAIFFLLGGIFILPTFYILPIIYALYKAERQNLVVMLNFGGAGLVFLLNLWFLPRFGILGAVISVVLVKWGLFMLYNKLAVGLKRMSPGIHAGTQAKVQVSS